MMFFRIVPHHDSFKLYRSPAPLDNSEVSGDEVSALDIQRGVDNSSDKNLQAFYLSMQVLLEGERRQRRTLELLTTTGVRDVKTGVRSAAEYLEIYRYAAIVRDRKNKAKRNKSEMATFNDLNQMLRTVFQPIKEKLGLPSVNPSEYSYKVPDSVVTAVRSNTCKGYLKSLVTYGVLTKYKFDKVISRLEHDFPDEAENIIAGIRTTESRDHLSAISFNDNNGQLLVSIVNVTGDLLRLEGYKLIRLVEEHNEWLSLGFLERKGDWLPDPFIQFNKELSGEIVARYSALESCFEVKCRTTDKKSNKTGISAQAVFIVDQDYLVCLYIAILRLKNDKSRFEELREIADTKVVANMADLEADFFD